MASCHHTVNASWHDAIIYFVAPCHYAFGMTEKPLARDLDKFIVRLPGDLRDRIREAAEANGRSMNSEVVSRLEASFSPQPPNTMMMEAMAHELQAIYERHSLMKVMSRLTERYLRASAKDDPTLVEMADTLSSIADRDDERQRLAIEYSHGLVKTPSVILATEEGRKAYRSGALETDVPYPPDTSWHDGWMHGYVIARYDAEADLPNEPTS